MTLIKTFLLAGLALPLIASAASTNLVTNGGFEAGSFTGWTVAGNTKITSDYGVDCSSGIEASGSCAAYFGEPTTATTLTQSIAVAAAAQYTISFAISQAFGVPSSEYKNAFTATFNGVSLTSGSQLPDSEDVNGNPVYTTYSYTVTTTAAGSDALAFSFRDDDGLYLLDNVSVVSNAAAVPETSTTMLMGAGLLALGLAARRQRQ